MCQRKVQKILGKTPVDHYGKKVGGLLDLFETKKRRLRLLTVEKVHQRTLSMGRERFLPDGQLAQAGGSSL